MIGPFDPWDLFTLTMMGGLVVGGVVWLVIMWRDRRRP